MMIARLLRACAIAFASMLCTQSVTAHSAEAPRYVVGVVPQYDSRTLYDIWMPILAELEKRTGYKFELSGSSSIPTFEKRLAGQEFDFSYMNPYHYIIASKNYLPLVRDTESPLQGIIVVNKNGPIDQLSDLQGKRMDFPAPNALGASLMTRALLDKKGVGITPRYVKTHSSVYLNVALGQTDAGGGVQRTLDEQPDEVKAKLRVLETTPVVAPHPFTASKRIGKAVREKVQAALLDMDKTAEGHTLLVRIPFGKAGPATQKDYEPLRRMKLERFYVGE